MTVPSVQGGNSSDRRSELAPHVCSELLEFAEELADRSRKIVAAAGSRENISVRHKGNQGPISDVDVEIEKCWVSQIKRRFPTHGVVGEETGSIGEENGLQWVLDPIDGTDDFIRGIPLFGSIISVAYFGRPVVGLIDHPELDIRCSGAYGLGAHRNGDMLDLGIGIGSNFSEAIVVPAFADFRELECAESKLLALFDRFPNHRIFRNVYGHTLVASGQFLACLEVRISSWDILATQIIIEEAKGRYITIITNGVGLGAQKRTVVFGSELAVETIVELLR